MSTREISAERLIGRTVYAANGRRIGRLQEIAVEMRSGECYVTQYLVGAYGWFERFAASEIGRAVLHALKLADRSAGYRVPWPALDLTDPARPRLRVSVKALRPLVEDEA